MQYLLHYLGTEYTYIGQYNDKTKGIWKRPSDIDKKAAKAGIYTSTHLP